MNCRFNAPIHLEVLQTLLLSSSCPRLVLALCGPRVMSLLASRTRKGVTNPVGLNIEELNRVLTAALGAREEGFYISTKNSFQQMTDAFHFQLEYGVLLQWVLVLYLGKNTLDKLSRRP